MVDPILGDVVPVHPYPRGTGVRRKPTQLIGAALDGVHVSFARQDAVEAAIINLGVQLPQRD